MYINDIHILAYVLIGIIGLVVGQIIDYCNKRLPEYKKILSKEFFTEYLKTTKPNYILMLITAVMYVGLLYNFNFTIDLAKYLLLYLVVQLV